MYVGKIISVKVAYQLVQDTYIFHHFFHAKLSRSWRRFLVVASRIFFENFLHILYLFYVYLKTEMLGSYQKHLHQLSSRICNLMWERSGYPLNRTNILAPDALNPCCRRLREDAWLRNHLGNTFSVFLACLLCFLVFLPFYPHMCLGVLL